MKTRLHLHFYGSVQGVGFRYTAYHLAQSLGLTGWVRNDWDGSVQMEAQGDSDAISRMLERLDAAPFIQIDRLEQAEIPVLSHDLCFEVRGD